MDEEKYSFSKLPEVYFYEFFSIGPKGAIKKIIKYRLIEEFPNRIYNLSFGDFNIGDSGLNDKIKTNNNDRQKVLATVSDTIVDFTENRSDAWVFAEGSTNVRTRLYQMSIAAFWKEISDIFIVLGYYEERWEPFEKGKNYEGFLIRRK